MINIQPEKFGTLHFIGIGGIGMSGIAEALHTLGTPVQGSDASSGYNTERLQRRGINVMIGHDAKHLTTPDGNFVAAVVVSSAIKCDNPELIAARALKIPVVRRADMLAELMRLKKTVAVAGTHGKTTTTSLVGALLESGGLDPTIINGGIIHAYGTNTRMGSGDWMVVESDESDGSFTRLPTTIAVVTNIDPEHMEHYGSFNNVITAYRNFIEQIPFYGFAVACTDHPVVQELAASITDRRVLTYGLTGSPDVLAIDIRADTQGSNFDVTFGSRVTGDAPETWANLHLPMMGTHNVLNCLAALTIARTFDLSEESARHALEVFQGVKRRFTKTGESHGITVIDDYGHHPVEIKTTLKAARQMLAGTNGRVIAVIQPHRYTRLSSLFDQFCACAGDADTVIIADVYAAGEQPIVGFDRASLANGLRQHGHKNVHELNHPDALADMIHKLAHSGDVVMCLGAGNITSWAHALPEQLDALNAPLKAAHG
jgi:UDP-N-acetylmuramate--alanine ligase